MSSRGPHLQAGLVSPASTDDRVAVGAACVARAAGEPRAHTAGLVAAPAIGVGTRVTARGKRRLGCHRGTRGRRPACWHSCARWDPAAVGPTARPGGWCCLGRRCGGSGSSRCAPGHGARARGATQASSEPPTPRSGHCSEAGTDPGRVAPVRQGARLRETQFDDEAILEGAKEPLDPTLIWYEIIGCALLLRVAGSRQRRAMVRPSGRGASGSTQDG